MSPAGPPAPEGPVLESSRADLRQGVRHVHRQAGAPSLRQLEERLSANGYGATTPISASTLGRVLSGRQVPRWRVLKALLDVFEDLGADVDRQHLRKLWSRAYDATDPRGPLATDPEDGPEDRAETHEPVFRPRPGSQTAQPAHEECEDCGALVANLVRHQAWHWTLAQQLSRQAQLPAAAADPDAPVELEHRRRRRRNGTD